MKSMGRRLRRLETQRAQMQDAASHVIYLEACGEPEDPRYLDGGGPWIFLPRKAASPEAWVQECALRGQRR